MTKHTKNEEKSENPKDSALDEPNLKGDWLNFYFLILLYTFQGTTSGLSYAFPIILQNTKFVTYNDQVSKNINLYVYQFFLVT
jgi:MFS transporter, PAT family, solute carrier family 33 (acetyl-CoA transportor), member 1